jgi:uncharacterized protein (DUF58 family)
VGRLGEWLGVREYRAGDRLRDIHWRKTAQTGRPVVREHHEETSQRVALELDNCARGKITEVQRTEFERAVSRCASLAVHHLACGRAVSLETRGQRIPLDAGPAQVRRILSCLALVELVPLFEGG